MPDFPVTRAAAILAASLRLYRDQLGLAEVALYDDLPYATLTAAGARISLAEQGHPALGRPGVSMTAPAPADRARANVVLVLEVPDADAGRAAEVDGPVAGPGAGAGDHVPAAAG